MKFELYVLTETKANKDYLVIYDSDNKQVVEYVFMKNRYMETLVKDCLKQDFKQQFYERKDKKQDEETEKTLF